MDCIFKRNDLFLHISDFVLISHEWFFKRNDFFDKIRNSKNKTDNLIMLTFNFSRIFKARGIDKPFSYLVKVGYYDNFATRIVNNRIKRLDLADIEKLCELLKCTPNDLLEWIPDSKDKTNDKHPLISIKRSDKVVQLSQILNSVPLDKLSEIESVIKKEMER